MSLPFPPSISFKVSYTDVSLLDLICISFEFAMCLV